MLGIKSFRRLTSNILRPSPSFRLNSSGPGPNMVNASPNEKTHILLERLAPTATLESLTNSLKDIKLKRVNIEPGFCMHLTNAAAAQQVSQIIKNKFNANVILF